jgi:hypothetical protein
VKNIRVEVRLVVTVYCGEDVTEGASPEREADVSESVRLVRVSHLGERVPAREAASETFVNLLANAIPVEAERLRHALREKGL